MASSNSFLLLVLSMVLFTDTMFATFPTPFLPVMLANENTPDFLVGAIMSAFFTASLFGYVGSVLLSMLGKQTPESAERRAWLMLRAFTILVFCTSLVIIVAPNKYVIFAMRALEGLGSAVSWTYSMALCSRVKPVFGMDAMVCSYSLCCSVVVFSFVVYCAVGVDGVCERR